MITYFSPSCGLFLELFFCLPQRFLKPSRIVFPLFQHLLLILLKLRNLFDNAISKNMKRKAPLSQRWDLWKVPNAWLRTSRSDEGEGNENNKKVKQQLCKCVTLSYISLPSLHDHDVKMPHFTVYGGRKPPRNFLHLDMVLRNLNPGEFGYIWQSNRVGILAILKWKKRILLIFKQSFCRPPWILRSIFRQTSAFNNNWSKMKSRKRTDRFEADLFFGNSTTKNYYVEIRKIK